MKRALSLCRGILAMACLTVLGAAAVHVPTLVPTPAEAPRDANLEKVLGEMDSAAEKFHTTEASVVWDQYQKVVDEHEEQKGTVYFRRSSHGIQMAADITEPDQKYVLFNNSKIQVFQPKIDQVTVYNTGKNQAEFESFLVLGFGGSGHDMLQSFDVKYLGNETLDGAETAKLDLVPKAAACATTLPTSCSGSILRGEFRCSNSSFLAAQATFAWPSIRASR